MIGRHKVRRRTLRVERHVLFLLLLLLLQMHVLLILVVMLMLLVVMGKRCWGVYPVVEFHGLSLWGRGVLVIY